MCQTGGISLLISIGFFFCQNSSNMTQLLFEVRKRFRWTEKYGKTLNGHQIT